MSLTIRFNIPEIRGNRVIYSWTPTVGFTDHSYWVEYPHLKSICASPGKLMESCFPLVLAFSALGPLTIQLPVKLPEDLLDRWRNVCSVAGRSLFRYPVSIKIENGKRSPEYHSGSYNETALCFGGGTESLLMLSRLQKKGVSPILASFGGPNWLGE